MANAHTKRGLSWVDIMDRTFANRANENLTPITRNPAKRAHLAQLRAVERMGDYRQMAAAPSQYTVVDGMPPRTAYITYFHRAYRNSRQLRDA